jgi:hypothetical protein
MYSLPIPVLPIQYNPIYESCNSPLLFKDEEGDQNYNDIFDFQECESPKAAFAA